MSNDIAVSVVAVAGSIVVAAIGVLAELLRRQSGKASRSLDSVRSSAVDLNETIATTSLETYSLLEAIRGVKRDIDGLRDDIRHEREERLAVSSRLDGLASTVSGRTRSTKLRGIK